MYMIVKFFFLLVIFQLNGEIILLINTKIINRTIESYSLLEQLTHSIIFGILINSLYTLVEVFFIPFNLLILIAFNLIIVLIAFFINKCSFSSFFFIRFFQKIKIRLTKEHNPSFHLNFFVYLLMTICLFLYIQNLLNSNQFHQMHDTYLYLHHSLDAIRNGWNIYDPNYLGNFYSTKLFVFLLIPFLSINPANWSIIISQYFYGLQFCLFFLLLYSILNRMKFKSKFLIFILFLAGTYLTTWFFYILPSNWNILLILMLSQYLFDKNLKSSFLSAILVIFGIVLHFSTILMVGIPFFITLIIKFIKEPNSFFIYNFIKEKKKTHKKWFYYFLILGTLLILTIIITQISSIKEIWQFYISFNREDNENVPFSTWNNCSIGLISIIFVYIIIIRNRRRKSKNFHDHYYLFLFYFILSLYLTIYLLNVEFWSKIIHSLYLPYRFFVYHNLSFVILTPLAISFMENKEVYQKLKNIFDNKFKIIIPYFIHLKNFLRKYIKIPKFNNFRNYSLRIENKLRKITVQQIFILLILICGLIPQISLNIGKKFQFQQFANYEPTGYRNTFDLFNFNELENSTYLYNPNVKVRTVDWNFIHTYLADGRSIDLKESVQILQDSKYSDQNSNNSAEYLNFKEYLFNSTKKIYSYMALYKNIPENLRVCVNIDHIFLDNFTNPNLVNFILNDLDNFSIFSIQTGIYFENHYSVYTFLPRK